MTITQMAMMAWMAGTVAHAGQYGQTLTVYLRDRANIPPAVRIPAQALTTKMFAEIGVSLEWCKGEPVHGSSQLPVIIELVTETPVTRLPGALAFALPYEGTHITVFFDRIEKTQGPSTVLAHVIVHEITHIVQGISRHSDSGVMKANWTARDLSAMQIRPLPFAAMDVELFQHGLATRKARTVVLLAGHE
jgi:hypothetical protein